MARYIDADIMQDFLVETNDVDDWCVSQYNADWISSFIESRPTADVVEVENVNKTIDNLITEIHCLEAKCRKYEEEIARLKIIIKEMSEEDI